MGNNIANKWNMLDSYSEGQDIYGRDEEISNVSESIIDNVQTFIYGKSGIGKTSLIQAGVFPVLRQNAFFPVIIRLAFSDKEESLKDYVIRLIQQEAEREDLTIGKSAIKYSPIAEINLRDCSLYEYFSKMRFSDLNDSPCVPVLIFDQFEETINNEENWQRTVNFLKDELYYLLDDSFAARGQILDYTNYRIVISMREDYLYCLEDIIDQFSLWELRYNRFRIRSLDDAKAGIVIKSTCGLGGLEAGYEDKIVGLVIKLVKINSGTRFKEINTALLSLVCSLLSENASDGCIRYKDIRRINIYLNSYYDGVCDKVGGRATRYLEHCLITKDGRRSSIDESEALSSGKISKAELNYLVERRLIRRIKTDATSVRYEYIHDLFARMIYKRRREETNQWYQPAFKSMSRQMDFVQFIKQLTLTLLVLTATFIVGLYFYAITDHGTRDILSILDPRNGVLDIVYTYFMAVLAFCVPLFTKRLHDTGHSGWYLLLVPVSFFCLKANCYLPLGGTVLSVIHIMGWLLAVVMAYLFFVPSKSLVFKPKVSLEYQFVANKSFIDNLGFCKLFSIELLSWCICCMLTEGFYYYLGNISDWHIFLFKLPLPLLHFSLPDIVALFPVVLCFSPTLHARVRTFGYSEWLAYIPYFNILLLLECLIPDKVLRFMHLIKLGKGQPVSSTENDIFIELHDNLLVNSDSKPSYKTTSWLLVPQLLIPCFALFRTLDHSLSFGKRYYALVFACLNLAFIYLLVVILVFLNPNYLLIYLGLFFALIIYIILQGKAIANEMDEKILMIVKSTPEISIVQIANELDVSVKDMERRVKRLQKKNMITRTVSEGKVVWHVTE